MASYADVGTSETVTRIASSAGGTLASLVTSAGDRLAVADGTTLNWLLPDLHGNVAAALDETDETDVADARRYDPYGETIDTGAAAGTTAVGPSTWSYQGRLDVSPAGLDSPLLDMSARFYALGLDAFTPPDSVMGSAQNPFSMNRRR